MHQPFELLSYCLDRHFKKLNSFIKCVLLEFDIAGLISADLKMTSLPLLDKHDNYHALIHSSDLYLGILAGTSGTLQRRNRPQL
jgi:hypothetical protein